MYLISPKGKKGENMTKIKICGLKSLEDVNLVNKYLPEYIGFVFAGNKRRIHKDRAVILKKALHPSIKAVGVFVNEPIEKILDLCQEEIIDIIQLHGDEDEGYIQKLKDLTNNPIIKAVGVDNELGILSSLKYQVNYMLFDSAVKGQYGGSGISFDHSVLTKQTHPFFLAGGLHTGNVVKAITDLNPYCVDVSSGVETNGMKDEDKIKEFIDVIRNMDMKKMI